MPNLTLADLYDPTVISFSKIIMDLSLLLQIFMLPFISYAILRKSGPMGIYRWYIINGAFWNSAFVIGFGMVSPALLGVYPMLMINSFMEMRFTIGTWYFITEFCCFCLINTAAGLSMSVAYRIVHLLNLTELFPVLNVVDKPLFLIVLIGVVQVLAAGAVYLIFEVRRTSALSKENYDNFLNEVPVLEALFRDHRILAFGGRDTDITVFIIIFFSLSIIYIILAVFLTIFPIIFLKRTKKNRSPTTYELQIKLYRAVLMQGWIIMFLAVFPACLVLFTYWRRIPGSAIWVQISLSLSSLHGPVDLFVIGYFIPSHRKLLIQLFHLTFSRLKNLSICRNNTTSQSLGTWADNTIRSLNQNA